MTSSGSSAPAEAVYPALGQEIADALLTPTPRCARRFLELVERELGDRVTPSPAAAVKTLRQHLDAVDAASDGA